MNPAQIDALVADLVEVSLKTPHTVALATYRDTIRKTVDAHLSRARPLVPDPEPDPRLTDVIMCAIRGALQRKRR